MPNSLFPDVPLGSFLVIRADGGARFLPQQPSLSVLKDALGCTTIDVVILTWLDRITPDLVMIVDDDGWEYEVIDRGGGYFHHRPLRPKPGKLVNPAATAIYQVCMPGTSHQIVGDVAICHDRDVTTTTQRRLNHDGDDYGDDPRASGGK